MIKHCRLPSGKTVPALGQGTWMMGEHASQRKAEITALRLGLDLGMTLIDTAEMYGEGGAEELVGEALRGRREDVYLVSKVYPHNATRHGSRLRAQPESSGLRLSRSVASSLARCGAAGRNARSAAVAQRGRKIPRLRREQLRYRRHGRSGRSTGRRTDRRQSGAVQPYPPRHRMGSGAVVPPARHSRHGLFADRAFAARIAPDAAASATDGDRAKARRDAGANRPRLAAASRADHRVSESNQCATCARKPRRAGNRVERRRSGATGPSLSAAAPENAVGDALSGVAKPLRLQHRAVPQAALRNPAKPAAGD